MAPAHRRPLVAGNWKMNKTASEGVDLVKEIVASDGQQTDVHVAVCPPYTALAAVAPELENSTVQLGAQNMHHEASGAYTGEVSAEMLRNLFVTFVILGHSERREYFAEDDAFINKKVLAALANSLRPILCVGETLDQREADQTLAVIQKQVEGGLAGVAKDQAEQIVIAYEPVWAIGTGKSATPEMAQEAHAAIRKLLAAQFDTASADKIRILYGGSMKPGNADELMKQPDVDGGLIGGASLKSQDFLKIIEAAQAHA